MEEVLDIISGPCVGMLVYSVMKYSIPKKLSQSPQTVRALCANSSLLPSKLERTLFALEAFGYFHYEEQAENGLTTTPLNS